MVLPGAGTELYRGLGAIVLFGLAFTAFITLTFLPSLLVTLLGLMHRRQPRGASDSQPPPSER